MNDDGVVLFHGPALARYGFGDGHPFGADRLDAFIPEARRRGLLERVRQCDPVAADRDLLARFHLPAHIVQVEELCVRGRGWLDCGNTPAEPHLFEAASHVVGSTVAASRMLLSGECRRAFSPIGGLHHARANAVEGFCVFNDIGVAIESIRAESSVRRIAYVDIDAHHGDGVYYHYQSDPDLCVADFHEDGRFIYPGSGGADECGLGPGRGTKLNVPLAPDAGDEAFFAAWPAAESMLDAFRPQLVILQAGVDSLAGDPLTHLRLSVRVHDQVTRALCRLADRHGGGRLLALGGGGYSLENLAQGWCTVLEALLDSRPLPEHR